MEHARFRKQHMSTIGADNKEEHSSTKKRHRLSHHQLIQIMRRQHVQSLNPPIHTQYGIHADALDGFYASMFSSSSTSS